MKKLWFGAAIVALVVVSTAVASWMASRRAAAVHFETVLALQGTESVTVLSDHFTRGVNQSMAAIDLEVGGAAGQWLRGHLERGGIENARPRFGVRIRVELAHGLDIAWEWLTSGAHGEPIVAVALTEVALDGETANDLGLAFGRIPPASFVTEIRWTGAHETSVLWEAARLESRSQESPWTADWRGLDGLLTRSALGGYQAHLAGGGFEWSGVTGQLSVGGFDLEIKGERDSNGEWIGDVAQRWRDVVWTPARAVDPEGGEAAEGEGRWALEDLRVDVRSGREPTGIERTIDLRAAGGAIDGAALEAALLSARLREPPVPVGRQDGGAVADPSAPGLELFAPLDAIAPYLARGPALDPFRFEILAENGSLALEGSLRIDPAHPAAVHPMSALDALVGELAIEARGELAGRFGLDEGIFTAWAEAGFARVDGAPERAGEPVMRARFALAHGILGPAPIAPQTVELGAEAAPAADGTTTFEVPSENPQESVAAETAIDRASAPLGVAIDIGPDGVPSGHSAPDSSAVVTTPEATPQQPAPMPAVATLPGAAGATEAGPEEHPGGLEAPVQTGTAEAESAPPAAAAEEEGSTGAASSAADGGSDPTTARPQPATPSVEASSPEAQGRIE